ncbi:fluoride efflux transporter CrcB [Sediminibacillus dalangtanensis]|uniref:Fluoride-specific ion channel FluC n=1 Tax=Sediminibacillus dalangtanensis TaxID=2729421 RepID=A0ABX7VXJ3_9BACI|nr:fluoride efflux transporter CrcB [Sediminibacillus dalangtanensis]QTN00244.1 fluoride efflux transporter CrcB [Sediminibacillus dalangtanensis]
MIYLFVGIAGSLGAMLRYGIGLAFYQADAAFPISTLLINLAGSFLLAWLTGFVFTKANLSTAVQSAIGTGFVGSFTTFSTLSVETVDLFHDERLLLAILYVLTSIIGGLTMSKLGYQTVVRDESR